MEHNRDRILGFLQLFWAEIVPMIAQAQSASQLRESLSGRFGYLRSNYPGLDILLNHPIELWSFIKDSGRYNGHAIEIASAMAGVPEMKPRSSFDYFFAKANINEFKAQPVWAMAERTKRIAANKRRQPRRDEA
jgi:hypothetical protein